MSALLIVILSVSYWGAMMTMSRLLAGHLAWRWMRIENKRYHLAENRASRPNGDQWFGAWSLALLAAFVWPLLVLPWYVGRHVAVGEEREARLALREAKVKQLERELGIND